MDKKELKKLVKTMRSMGLKTYKCGDVELVLSDEPVRTKVKVKEPQDDKIKHTIENMQSVMKLGDEELLDILFPDHVCYDDDPSTEVTQ